MNIQELFTKENRDVLSIYDWLRTSGFKDYIIDRAIAEHAQRISDGEEFGYTEAGISILTNSIRTRCRELRVGEKLELIAKFGDFKPTKGWFKEWRERKQELKLKDGDQ